MKLGGRTVCYWYRKYPPGSLSASTVVGRRVCSRRPSRGVCGSFDDRRPSSQQTTIVVPTKIAWCVPSFTGRFLSIYNLRDFEIKNIELRYN